MFCRTFLLALSNDLRWMRNNRYKPKMFCTFFPNEMKRNKYLLVQPMKMLICDFNNFNFYFDCLDFFSQYLCRLCKLLHVQAIGIFSNISNYRKLKLTAGGKIYFFSKNETNFNQMIKKYK